MPEMTDYRILFSKNGPLIYISHLDLTHTMIRAFNRAKIRLRHSQGFNPHPKIVFALPLSVGMSGENELCDVGIEEDIPAEEFKVRLQRELPEFLTVKDVYAPDKKFKEIKSALYSVEFQTNANICEEISSFLSKEDIPVLKTTKSGEKTVNIKNQIISYNIGMKCEKPLMNITVVSSPSDFLNPEYVIKALNASKIAENIPYRIQREKIFF